MTGHNSRVLHLAQSPDGVTVCSAAADETLRFWKCFAEAAPAKVGAALADAMWPLEYMSTALQSSASGKLCKVRHARQTVPIPFHFEAESIYCISVQVSERSRLPVYTVSVRC